MLQWLYMHVSSVSFAFQTYVANVYLGVSKVDLVLHVFFYSAGITAAFLA
jgi:hypothetical protein